MKIRTLFITLMVACLCSVLIVRPAAAAEPVVRILVVGDEEYRDHAQSPFGHYMDWKTLSSFHLCLSMSLFWRDYKIELMDPAYREWQSPPTTNATKLMEWAKDDMGFVSGQTWDIMVIFTGQDITDAGQSWIPLRIVIVYDGWTYFWWGKDYAVSHIMAHEISHLYGAPNHYRYQEGYNYCLMSVGDAGLTSTVWCTTCYGTIMANRTNLGRPYTGGGGGYGGGGRFVVNETLG